MDLLQVVATYYPNWKYTNLELTIELWHNILVDYEQDTILENLRDYVKSGKEFAPIVGQLLPQKAYGPAIPGVEETRQMLLEMDKPKELPTADELKAIFEKMDEMLGVKRG